MKRNKGLLAALALVLVLCIVGAVVICNSRDKDTAGDSSIVSQNHKDREKEEEKEEENEGEIPEAAPGAPQDQKPGTDFEDTTKQPENGADGEIIVRPDFGDDTGNDGTAEPDKSNKPEKPDKSNKPDNPDQPEKSEESKIVELPFVPFD